MATVTLLEDDLNGQRDETVATRVFALDGTTYELELSDENYARLCATLTDYVNAARKVASRRGRPRGSGSAPAAVTGPTAPARVDREQTKAIRDWARSFGYPINERGRIPQRVQDLYHAGDKAGMQALADEKVGTPEPTAAPEPANA